MGGTYIMSKINLIYNGILKNIQPYNREITYNEFLTLSDGITTNIGININNDNLVRFSLSFNQRIKLDYCILYTDSSYTTSNIKFEYKNDLNDSFLYDCLVEIVNNNYIIKFEYPYAPSEIFCTISGIDIKLFEFEVYNNDVDIGFGESGEENNYSIYNANIGSINGPYSIYVYNNTDSIVPKTAYVSLYPSNNKLDKFIHLSNNYNGPYYNYMDFCLLGGKYANWNKGKFYNTKVVDNKVQLDNLTNNIVNNSPVPSYLYYFGAYCFPYYDSENSCLYTIFVNAQTLCIYKYDLNNNEFIFLSHIPGVIDVYDTYACITKYENYLFILDSSNKTLFKFNLDNNELENITTVNFDIKKCSMCIFNGNIAICYFMSDNDANITFYDIVTNEFYNTISINPYLMWSSLKNYVLIMEYNNKLYVGGSPVGGVLEVDDTITIRRVVYMNSYNLNYLLTTYKNYFIFFRDNTRTTIDCKLFTYKEEPFSNIEINNDDLSKSGIVAVDGKYHDDIGVILFGYRGDVITYNAVSMVYGYYKTDVLDFSEFKTSVLVSDYILNKNTYIGGYNFKHIKLKMSNSRPLYVNNLFIYPNIQASSIKGYKVDFNNATYLEQVSFNTCYSTSNNTRIIICSEFSYIDNCNYNLIFNKTLNYYCIAKIYLDDYSSIRTITLSTYGYMFEYLKIDTFGNILIYSSENNILYIFNNSLELIKQHELYNVKYFEIIFKSWYLFYIEDTTNNIIILDYSYNIKSIISFNNPVTIIKGVENYAFIVDYISNYDVTTVSKLNINGVITDKVTISGDNRVVCDDKCGGFYIFDEKSSTILHYTDNMVNNFVYEYSKKAVKLNGTNNYVVILCDDSTIDIVDIEKNVIIRSINYHEYEGATIPLEDIYISCIQYYDFDNCSFYNKNDMLPLSVDEFWFSDDNWIDVSLDSFFMPSYNYVQLKYEMFSSDHYNTPELLFIGVSPYVVIDDILPGNSSKFYIKLDIPDNEYITYSNSKFIVWWSN